MNLVIGNKKENENNKEYAYRIIRSNIMTLQMLPGSVINEGELAKIFGISRTPIHEAVMKLKEEYLIDVVPQSGSKVSLIDIDIMKEGYFLRSLIEPELVSQIAGKKTREELTSLRENILQQERASELKGDVDTFFQLDDEFHRIIYEMAGKKRSWISIKGLCGHYDRVRYLDAIMNNTNLKEICEEHKQIYNLILTGMQSDFRVKEFYEKHLETYKKQFHDIMKEYPQYFIL